MCLIFPCLQIHFGAQFSKVYLNADLFNINCMTGMSCLFRKVVLAEAGGIKALGVYMAEDYYLAHTFISR